MLLALVLPYLGSLRDNHRSRHVRAFRHGQVQRAALGIRRWGRRAVALVSVSSFRIWFSSVPQCGRAARKNSTSHLLYLPRLCEESGSLPGRGPDPGNGSIVLLMSLRQTASLMKEFINAYYRLCGDAGSH